MADAEIQKQVDMYNESWQAVDKLYGEYAKANGLTFIALEVLETIYEHPEGCTQKYICQKTFLPKQSVNTLVKDLWQQGYVELKETKADRRNKLVKLSKAGKAYAGGIVGRLWQAEQTAMEQLTSEERLALIAAMDKLTQSLRASFKAEMGEE